MRRRHIWRDGKWIEVHRAPPRPRIHIIRDTHAPFRSMADGQVYDSKSAYRADLKARGFVELGSDQPEHDPPCREGDIAQDIADAMNGNVPIERGVDVPAGFDTSDLT